MPTPKMKIEQVATSALIPYARNAKTHPPAQVAKIAGSIKEFGFCNPVLIDDSNGIVAGHGRVLAAHLLELQTVPCIRLSHLSDAQRRAYMLADNRLGEVDGAGWDAEMLKLELGELGDLDLGFDLTGLNFDPELLAGTALGDEEPPADPEEPPQGNFENQFGVIVLCEDETRQEQVFKELTEAGHKCKVVCV